MDHSATEIALTPAPSGVEAETYPIAPGFDRGAYRPAAPSAADARQKIASAVLAGAYTAEGLLRNYTTLLYAKTPNYSRVADKLQVDRRTVRARVDASLLDELKA